MTGKTQWIDARAAVLVKLRRMTEGEALAKAKEEFAYLKSLDAKTNKIVNAV